MAMDFSGKAGGRVIQNPMEAQSAEREEGLAWRVRMEGGADAGPDFLFLIFLLNKCKETINGAPFQHVSTVQSASQN